MTRRVELRWTAQARQLWAQGISEQSDDEIAGVVGYGTRDIDLTDSQLSL